MIHLPGLSRGRPDPEPEPDPEPVLRADDGGLCEKVPAEARLEATRYPRHRFLRWLVNDGHPEPLPSVHGPVEDPVKGKLGICCSGGGIRSAAFSLGALQVLQEREQLKRASYLAAVSGGSYIATAISLVAKSGPEGSDKRLLDKMKPFEPGSPEEQYLRNRCSYLAPTLSDKIFLGWRVVLGLLLNLLIVSLPLIVIALLLAGLVYAPAFPRLAGECNGPEALGCAVLLPWWVPWATLGPLGLSVLFGVATLLPRWRREAWERFFASWAMRLLLLSVLMGLMLIALPFIVKQLGTTDGLGAVGDEGVKGGFGASTLVLLAGVIAQLGHLLTSNQTKEEFGRARKLFGKLGKAARIAIAYFAAALVGPLLLFAVFVLAVAVGMGEANMRGAVDPGLVWTGVLVLAGFSVVYFLSDLTTWSLHPFYKRRLSSVFALKRISTEEARGEDRDRVEAPVPPDPMKDIGVAVERDFDSLMSISSMALKGEEGEEWPTLLICAAANISDTNATPPGRRVTSFTFSGYSVGGPLVGAVPTTELETAFEEPARKDGGDGGLMAAVKEATPAPARRRRRRDMSLVAAMAMSGAAISPSMGKMTRRPLTFLMALANIRLGVWVPNPRWVGELHRRPGLRLRNIRPRPFYLLCELLGHNRVGSKYLYVTDGGHYEDLGLVELLRRGCTDVYCLDASGVGAGGVEFEALGEAIALARSELGVEIEFDGERDPIPAGEDEGGCGCGADKEEDAVDGDGNKEKAGKGEMTPAEMIPDEKSHLAKRDVVIGRIKYRKGPEGRLIYVRNTMTDKAPWDARSHHKADPRFPNNPTIDQLYTDQKFEAYRVLGARAAERAVDAAVPPA